MARRRLRDRLRAGWRRLVGRRRRRRSSAGRKQPVGPPGAPADWVQRVAAGAPGLLTPDGAAVRWRSPSFPGAAEPSPRRDPGGVDRRRPTAAARVPAPSGFPRLRRMVMPMVGPAPVAFRGLRKAAARAGSGRGRRDRSRSAAGPAATRPPTPVARSAAERPCVQFPSVAGLSSAQPAVAGGSAERRPVEPASRQHPTAPRPAPASPPAAAPGIVRHGAARPAASAPQLHFAFGSPPPARRPEVVRPESGQRDSRRAGTQQPDTWAGLLRNPTGSDLAAARTVGIEPVPPRVGGPETGSALAAAPHWAPLPGCWPLPRARHDDWLGVDEQRLDDEQRQV